MPTTETKFCPSCKTEQPLDNWHRKASNPDGLQSQCAPCQRAAVLRSRERKRAAERWASAQLRLKYHDEYDTLVKMRLAGVR